MAKTREEKRLDNSYGSLPHVLDQGNDCKLLYIMEINVYVVIYSVV